MWDNHWSDPIPIIRKMASHRPWTHAHMNSERTRVREFDCRVEETGSGLWPAKFRRHITRASRFSRVSALTPVCIPAVKLVRLYVYTVKSRSVCAYIFIREWELAYWHVPETTNRKVTSFFKYIFTRRETIKPKVNSLQIYSRCSDNNVFFFLMFVTLYD